MPTMVAAPVADSLESLIRRRKPGYSLEQAFYTSPEIFEADLDMIFRRHWIYVGVEPDVPEPGDYMAVDIGSASILIVRDDEWEIRAFHNVCRHRGAATGAMTRSHGRQHRVPLPPLDLRPGRHACCSPSTWGRASTAPATACRAVHCARRGPDLHLPRRRPARGFRRDGRRMEPYLAPHDLVDAKVAQQIDIDRGRQLEAHDGEQPRVLPLRGQPSRADGPALRLRLRLRARTRSMRPAATEVARYDGWSATASRAGRRRTARRARSTLSRPRHRLPHRTPAARPRGRDRRPSTPGSPVAQLLGDSRHAKLGGLSFWTQPNSWHHFMSDHIVTFCGAAAVAGTHAPAHQVARAQGRGRRRRLRLENLTAVWRATNEQDRELVESTQARRAQPGLRARPVFAVTPRCWSRSSATGTSAAWRPISAQLA